MRGFLTISLKNWRTSLIGLLKLGTLSVAIGKSFHLILQMSEVTQIGLAVGSIYVIIDSLGNFLQKDGQTQKEFQQAIDHTADVAAQKIATALVESVPENEKQP